jgi:hypothetical protein
MSGEYGIPFLSSTSKNWIHFDNMFTSHLSSVGESRLLDFNHVLPTKEIIIKTLNPNWVDEDVAPTSSVSGSTDPPPPRILVPKYHIASHLETDSIVKSYSPGLDKLRGETLVPYNLLNQQLIVMLARLIDKSIHHLLKVPSGSDPFATARGVYRAVKKHFQPQSWADRDDLRQKWNAITTCVSPESTYNELLSVEDECNSAGVGHSAEEVATKFAHLLQTHHSTAYIGLFTDLAKAGDQSTIQMLWHSAKITANALSRNAVLHKIKDEQATSQHLGMAAQSNGRSRQGWLPGPCTWCTATGHNVARCFAKDPQNMTKYPHPSWENQGPPESMKSRYHKPMTQLEATSLYTGVTRQLPPAPHQAAQAWTPPPIFTAVLASTSTHTVPTDITGPEPVTMQAATIGDGLPHISNLW